VKHLEEEQFLPCLQLALEQCVDLMFAHVDLVDFHETVLAADHNFDAAKYYNVGFRSLSVFEFFCLISFGL